MRRREFITLLGGAAGWPLAARAQQPVPVIGYLGVQSAQDAPALVPFRQGLGEAGFVEGQNLTIDYRWAEGQRDRAPALAAELVRRQVAVIAASNTSMALAATAATSTIPIVFNSGDDPVRVGLVASLNRPGGNATGVTNLSTMIEAKRLSLLREIVPAAATLGALVDPNNPNAKNQAQAIEDAARA